MSSDSDVNVVQNVRGGREGRERGGWREEGRDRRERRENVRVGREGGRKKRRREGRKERRGEEERKRDREAYFGHSCYVKYGVQ